MFKEYLLSYYTSQFKKIKQNYLLAAKKRDSEGIHYLRVETRRIKAFFDLVKSINNEFRFKNHYRGLRYLFEVSGELRDIHVQKVIAKEIEMELNINFIDYTVFLQNKELIAEKRFSDCIKIMRKNILKPNKKIIKRALSNISDDITAAGIKNQFEFLLNQLINCGNSEELKEDKLHQIRIFSKKARYSIEIIQRCFPDLWNKNDIVGLLKEIHQVLGKWHDYEVSLDFLKSFKIKYSTNQAFEIKTYNMFLKNIKMKKVLLFSEFKTKWEICCAMKT